ncbi:IS1595 family transposase [Helicobacter pylori]|uniref:IS1595 family transposase n=1 Tax=Helicobacter pylori TaxID=210 RepID=UPI00165A9521|nr:IS1595 family transposase [Helicobacter pylori]
MTQHFLLSSRAKQLSLLQIAKMSDSEALKTFADIRWHSNDGNPICPHCGNAGKIYLITTRNEYKCNEYHKRFSVTRGTLFHSHKLPLQILLCAIVLFVNAVKGISALQLSRDLDIQYKSAFVLLHKLRESLINYQSDEPFNEVCEIDGVYVGNYIRPKNNINDRIDRRKAFKPNKRVVISLRQRDEIGSSANKSRTFVLKSENAFDINNIVRKYILRGSEVHTDENVWYSDLSDHYTHKVVNHAIEYMGSSGENNNQAENYNAIN